MPDYIREFKITEFRGLNTEVKNLRELRPIPVRGGHAVFSPSSLNWLTSVEGKRIELRRGTKLLHETRETGSGRVTGLGVGTRFDGVEQAFWTHGRKIKYLDRDDNEAKEIGTDTLPSDADGEEVSVFPYNNLAGSFVYLSSPNSSVYKIPTANPDSVVDQSENNYRGFLKFGQSRSFLYNRHGNSPGNIDLTSLYTSKVDKVALSQYPAQVTSESVGTGDGSEKTFTATLAQITGKRTAMFVEVTDGTETFRDDRNGGLVGDLGGTGTVNYATGAISVTFNTAPTNLQAITADYYYEDASSGGVVDFAISDVTNRQPGEGNIFPQFDGGGNLNSVFPLSTTFYCFHEKKTWQVAIAPDDESGSASINTNLPFRERMGVNSNYGAYGGERGIYFINTATEKPELMVLQLFTGATAANVAAPQEISNLIDLTDFNFDDAQVFEFQDFVLVACAQIRNGVADSFNSRVVVYNKKSGTFDLLEYPVSRFAEYDGALIAGDPLTDNVFVLFSGIDEDEGIIGNNFWTSGALDFGMEGQKTFSRIRLEGLIQSIQKVDVSLSLNGGEFVKVATIDGKGSYVDTEASVVVGNNTLGSETIGGGEIKANPFRVEFKVNTGRFEYVRVKLSAQFAGFFACEMISFADIRKKARKVPSSRVG